MQKWLGNKNLKMTQRYAHLTKNTLREAGLIGSSEVVTVINMIGLGSVTDDETTVYNFSYTYFRLRLFLDVLIMWRLSYQ